MVPIVSLCAAGFFHCCCEEAGSVGFFHLDSRIDAQGAELRTAIGAQGAELRAAIDAQGAELREGFKHVDQRIDGLYDLIAQDRR